MNISLTKGLKLSPLRASIDIGSNSVLLLIAEVKGEKTLNELENHASVTALGKGIDKTKLFAEESMNETLKTLKNYVDKIKKYNIKTSDVVVTATEASRVVKNSDEFFSKVFNETNLKVSIISSEGEAYYTALGVSLSSSAKESVIMDIGGASTELIKVRNDEKFEVMSSISLPIGSVRATDYRKENSFEKKITEIFHTFDISPYRAESLICVAGSMTSVGAMIKGLKKYSDFDINGFEFNLDKFENFISTYLKYSPTSLLEKFPYLGKRAQTISAGSLVGISIAKELGVRNFHISTYGLRYGTAFEGRINEKYLQNVTS